MDGEKIKEKEWEKEKVKEKGMRDERGEKGVIIGDFIGDGRGWWKKEEEKKMVEKEKFENMCKNQ